MAFTPCEVLGETGLVVHRGYTMPFTAYTVGEFQNGREMKRQKLRQALQIKAK